MIVVNGKPTHTELEQVQGLWVRKGYGPDYSLFAEWKSHYGKIAHHLKGQRILDIGANIGIFSRRALKLHGASYAACYEPEPGAFSVLQVNMRGLISTDLYPTAITLREQKVVYSFPKSGNSISGSTFFSARGRQKITLQSCSLRKAITRACATALKCDCEGEELRFLNGRTLPRQVEYVFVEIHVDPEGLYEQVIESFNDWEPLHRVYRYSFNRCRLGSWRRSK